MIRSDKSNLYNLKLKSNLPVEPQKEEGQGIPQTPQEEQQAETNYRVDNRLSSEINRNSTN